METENIDSKELQGEQCDSLCKVTPLSKYLAMLLFVSLPFIGGLVGYNYAPEKVIEVEKVIIKEVPAQEQLQEELNKVDVVQGNEEQKISTNSSVVAKTVTDINGLYQFSYPADWDLQDTQKNGYIQLFNHKYSSEYKKGWGTNENKLEGGSVAELTDLKVALSESNINLSDFTAIEIAGKKVYTRKEGDGPEAPWIWTTLAIPLPNNSQKVVIFTVYGDTDSIDDVIFTVMQDFVFLK